MLKLGDTGSEVIVLGRRLHDLGLLSFTKALQGVYDQSFVDAVAYFQQTHLGPDRKFLKVDGICGDRTLWALTLYNASGVPQISGLPDNRIPSGLSDKRVKLLTAALHEHQIGIQEIPDGSNRSQAPEGGIDKYLPSWAKTSSQGPPWCCFRASWVALQVDGKSYPLGQNEEHPMGRQIGSCVDAWATAEKEGRAFLYQYGRVPVPGDQFIMLYGGGHGHTGFVYRVSEDGNTINTSEGNCGNRDKIGTRSLLDGSIHGFIDLFSDGNLCKDFERGLVTTSSTSQEAVV